MGDSCLMLWSVAFSFGSQSCTTAEESGLGLQVECYLRVDDTRLCNSHLSDTGDTLFLDHCIESVVV